VKQIAAAWIACITLAAATAEEDASRAAISFLEKARAGKVDLAVGADTAISRDTDSDKTREIARRIKSLRAELPDDRFSAGPVLVEGDYAAVMIRQADGYDPSLYQVHAVGVVRREGKWMAAPVPGSFENTTTGYAAALGARARRLEDWMLKTRSLDLLSLQESAATRLRGEISKHANLDAARKPDANGFIESMLVACEKADLLTILGCLGGMDVTPPDNWPERLRAATKAFAHGTTPDGPWQMLAASRALRCVTSQDSGNGKANATLICLDPFSEPVDLRLPRFVTLQLDISRAPSGLWRFDPPDDFLGPPSRDHAKPDTFTLSKNQRSGLPLLLRRQIPATPMPSARAAADAWLAALRGPSFPESFHMLSLDDKPDVVIAGCCRIAQIWRRTHDSRRLGTPLLLDFHESGSSAVCIIQLFSAGNPSETDLHEFFFRKSADGWLLHPAVVPPPNGLDPEIISLAAWAAARESVGSRDWPARVTDGLPRVRELAPGQAPAPDDVRRLIDKWLVSLRQGDLNAALAASAPFDDERGAEKLLRALGSRFSLLQADGVKTTILAIRTGGRWAGVSLRVDDPRDAASPTYPFHAVVMTPLGPRVLPEIDLAAPTNRTREYLNTTSWSRLAAILPDDATDELRALFAQHIKTAEAERPAPPAKP
jgi:hypothetical protein